MARIKIPYLPKASHTSTNWLNINKLFMAMEERQQREKQLNRTTLGVTRKVLKKTSNLMPA